MYVMSDGSILNFLLKLDFYPEMTVDCAEVCQLKIVYRNIQMKW